VSFKRLPRWCSHARIRSILLSRAGTTVSSDGKAAISGQVAEVVDPTGSSAQNRQVRLENPRKGHLFRRFYAASRKRLREIAKPLRLERVPNLSRCPAP
jgi:hypothetical protein